MPFSLLVCFKVSKRFHFYFSCSLSCLIDLFPLLSFFLLSRSLSHATHMPHTRNWFWFRPRHERRWGARVAYVKRKSEKAKKMEIEIREREKMPKRKFIHNSWWVSANLSWLTACLMSHSSAIPSQSLISAKKAVNLSWKRGRKSQFFCECE